MFLLVCCHFTSVCVIVFIYHLNQFNTMAIETLNFSNDKTWRTPAFKQAVVSKIEGAIQQVQTTRTSSELENYLFKKAKTQEEYMILVAKLILHLQEMATTCPVQAPTGSKLQAQTPQTAGIQDGVITDTMDSLHNLNL